MIVVQSNQGGRSKKIGIKNKERVRKWFLSNPGMSIADCSRALGLTWPTVHKHVKSIQKEQ